MPIEAITCDYARCLIYLLVSMASEYLTLEEAAEQLRIHVETVRRWVLAKKIAAIRPGKKYLIPKKALAEFLELQAEKGVEGVVSLPAAAPKKTLAKQTKAAAAKKKPR